MQRYLIGDEVKAFRRGRGVILAVAKPGALIEDICRPVMAHMARLAMQGKRVTLPRADANDRFKGALTHYLIETDTKLEWVPWHLTKRVTSKVDPASAPVRSLISGSAVLGRAARPKPALHALAA